MPSLKTLMTYKEVPMAENRCSFVFYENYMDAVRHQPSEELRKELLYEICGVR